MQNNMHNMQEMQNLRKINYIRTGENRHHGTDRGSEDHRDRGSDRWNSPSSSSSCPYSRNSDHDSVRYDYSHGKRVRQLVDEDRHKPMPNKKQMKQQLHPERIVNRVYVTSYNSSSINDVRRISKINCLTAQELVSEIVKRLVLMGGTVEMDRLKNFVCNDGLIREVQVWSNDGTVEGLIKNYSDIFTVTNLGGGLWQNDNREDAGTTVTYNFSLQLCKVNNTKPGTCTGDCKNLHMCKFHLMSMCTSLGCRYGHGEEVGHNDDVLRQHYLDRLSADEITNQLCRLENRRGQTVPEFCAFFSTVKGCSKGDSCTYLHVCKFHILDKCRFSLNCTRFHSLSDKHSRKVLRLYGLEDVSDQRINEFLKQAYSDPSGLNRSNRIGGPSLDNVPCPRWIMHGGGQEPQHLLDTESRQLEEMYREYLDVVQRTITIKGHPVHVNIAQMTARLEGSQWGLQLSRTASEILPKS